MSAMPGLLVEVMLVSFAVLLPLTAAVGVLVLFRVAGPLYRFEQFLEAVMRGEHPEECHIRKRDELQDFCKLLNRVTAPLRASDSPVAETAVATRPEAAAEEQGLSPAA